MRINQNIAAFNAYRNLNQTQNQLSSSLEKLSSGFRINRAADDASGLVNSENLRSQIGGLKVATRNAQDAISLVQTAEGAQTEVHSILQRMRDLTVQSGNLATNDASALQANQDEITQLSEELDRISNQTQFGTKKILNDEFGGNVSTAIAGVTGNVVVGGGDVTNVAGAPASISFDLKDTNPPTMDLQVNFTIGGSARSAQIANADIYTNDGNIQTDFETALGPDAANYTVDVTNRVVTITANADGEDASVALGTVVDTADMGNHQGAMTATIDNGATEDITPGSVSSVTVDVTDLTLGDIEGDLEFVFDVGGTELNVTIAAADVAGLTSGALQTAIDTELADAGLDTDYETALNGTEVAIQTTANASATLALESVSDVVERRAVFQVGANATQQVTVGIRGVSAEALGVEDIDVTSGEADDIDTALTAIDAAIGTVSGNRATLGAFQNRMESTIRNISVAVENLSAAESRIRDTDMADEMVTFTRNQILQQAGTAMLAQANQVPQSVLSLLR